jgi:peptidoglycan/LPS O-acetylase OafA/YrhL
MPDELKALAESAIASVLFYSNYFFLRQASYFDAPSLTKPLLHTWSLGVEGQFYILFPLILVFVRHPLIARLGVSISLALGGALAASFLYSVFLVATDRSTAFYGLSARAWELLAGAVLAACGLRRVMSARSNALLQFLGLGMIGASAVAFSRNTPFPGLHAAFPVVGASLLIYSYRAEDGAPVSRFLEWKPMVEIGKVSYSIYLWHWPVLVLLPYAIGRESILANGLIALLLTFLLSAATYRWIERPFIAWKFEVRKRVALATGAVALFLAIALGGVLVAMLDGLPSRLPEQALLYGKGATDFAPELERCHTISPERIAEGDLCPLGTGVSSPSFVVWGDSHAHAMYGMFRRLATEYDVSGRHASFAACPPLLGVTVATHTNDACPRFNEAMVRYIDQHRVSDVFLVARWAVYVGGHTPNGVEYGPEPLLTALGGDVDRSADATAAVFGKALEETIKRLMRPGRTIHLLEQVPEATSSVPAALARASLPLALHEGRMGPRRMATDLRQGPVDESLNAISAKYGVELIRTRDFLCDPRLCRVSYEGRSLYRDADHLSAFGADYLSPLFHPAFERMHAR